MIIKIEDIVVKERVTQDSENFSDFIMTIKELKPGQSFTIPFNKFTSNYRNAIAIIRKVLDIKVGTKTEGDKMRIGRIS